MKVLGKYWNYIHEGNTHIVIQLKDTDYVLRLIKLDDKPVLAEAVAEALNFVNFIMVPLLHNYYYGIGKIVEISGSCLENLPRELQPHRPPQRLIKSTLSPIAIKTTNLAIVSSKCKTNYCIEIKPKEGFISSRLKLHSKCYFCLKQFMKLHDKDIKEASAYCPLDLFSGDRRRMKLALQNMVKNPQNNFKVFKNGIFFNYNELSTSELEGIIQSSTLFSSINMLLDFLVEVLLRDGNKSDNAMTESPEVPMDVKKNLCNEQNDLKPNNVLYNLLQLQKLSETVTLDLSEISEQNFDYVGKLLDQVTSIKLDLNSRDDRETFLRSVDPVHLALISAVAKDCSIMISFTADEVENIPYVDLENVSSEKRRVYYKVALTDLEPKPVSSLMKRKCTEQKIKTRAKQLEAWQTLITDYLKATKQSTIDIREAQNNPLFNNTEINRKLSQESVLTILEDMAKLGRAAPVDKSKNVWEVYWHSLDEWGNMVYNWACNNGMNNSVCTLFELREGDNTADEEFHGLDMNVLLKALKTLEVKGRCELMEFDDSQGVKFF